MGQYQSPEQKRNAKERAYHKECVEQYSDIASRLGNFPKMQRRALENADFHRRALESLDK